MFGQTKRTGEANMYPKPVQDLTGKYNFNSYIQLFVLRVI